MSAGRSGWRSGLWSDRQTVGRSIDMQLDMRTVLELVTMLVK